MAFFSTWTEKAEGIARFSAAYALLAGLLLLNVMALSYPFSGVIRAPLVLMAIYYWSIFRPTLIPSVLVFAAGLIVDLISGLPLGLNAFFFVLLRLIVADQRRFLMAQSFFMIWIAFCVLSLAVHILMWCVFGLLQGIWPTLMPVWITVILSAVLFPLICVILHFTHKILPAPQSSFSLKASG